MIFHFLILFLGVFVTSTSVIFIKLSQTDALLLAGYRALIAGVILLPLFIHALQYYQGEDKMSLLLRSLMPGIFLGVHFIAWNIGARLTPAANSTLIVNMLPIITPFLLFAMLREVINRAEVYGTLLSLAGLAVLGVADYRIDAKHALGDTICLVSMVLYAFYIVWGRKNRDIPSLWLYVVPLFLVAGVFTILTLCIGNAIGMLAVNPMQYYSTRELWLILALALIPTVLGHTILNYTLKHLRGQSVSIIFLSQFIFAGIMGYYIFYEIPRVTFYFASLLLVIGAIVVIFAAPPDTVERE